MLGLYTGLHLRVHGVALALEVDVTVEVAIDVTVEVAVEVGVWLRAPLGKPIAGRKPDLACAGLPDISRTISMPSRHASKLKASDSRSRTRTRTS